MALFMGFPGGSDSAESVCSFFPARLLPGIKKPNLPGFHPWVRKIPWRSEWLPSLVFLPGEFPGQKNLMGAVHGVTKSQTQLSMHAHYKIKNIFFILCVFFVCLFFDVLFV